MSTQASTSSVGAEAACFIRDRIPSEGLFAGHHWRISPEPFALDPKLVEAFERLGPVLLQFYRATNRLYRHSVTGRQPHWVADWLEQGKDDTVVNLQRSSSFRQEIPRVIRPDILLTDSGFAITELDSVPGGIGLTAWLNEVYTQAGFKVIGGRTGMLDGFESLFDSRGQVHVVISEEASTYRPEMMWLSRQLNDRNGVPRFQVRDARFKDFQSGDAIYRFFELFDLANVPNAQAILDRAKEKQCFLTPPPKSFFEEKMLFALLWNGHLQHFWKQHVGSGYLRRLQQTVPYTWVVDPTPLPPHGAIPELDIVAWEHLKGLSQKERNLILKVSGFSETAWGSRGVYLGSDLSSQEWSGAVDKALAEFSRTPFVLQRYFKPTTVESSWFDFDTNQLVPMLGRARLCPYYFVSGHGDSASVQLGGILATICSPEKKIIHGMKEAILAPCSVGKEPL